MGATMKLFKNKEDPYKHLKTYVLPEVEAELKFRRFENTTRVQLEGFKTNRDELKRLEDLIDTRLRNFAKDSEKREAIVKKLLKKVRKLLKKAKQKLSVFSSYVDPLEFCLVL